MMRTAKTALHRRREFGQSLPQEQNCLNKEEQEAQYVPKDYLHHLSNLNKTSR